MRKEYALILVVLIMAFTYGVAQVAEDVLTNAEYKTDFEKTLEDKNWAIDEITLHHTDARGRYALEKDGEYTQEFEMNAGEVYLFYLKEKARIDDLNAAVQDLLVRVTKLEKPIGEVTP